MIVTYHFWLTSFGESAEADKEGERNERLYAVQNGVGRQLRELFATNGKIPLPNGLRRRRSAREGQIVVFSEGTTTIVRVAEADQLLGFHPVNPGGLA